MIAIYDLAEIPTLPLSVRPLVKKVVQDANAAELQDRTVILIIEHGDSEEAVTRELGFNPLHDPIDDTRYDEHSFAAYWAWLERHSGWYRLIHTIGNGGFACELLIEAFGDGPFHEMCKWGEGRQI